MTAEMFQRVTNTIDDVDFINWLTTRSGIIKFPVYPDNPEMQEDLGVLELSMRSGNCLKRYGFTTVSSVMSGIGGREDLDRIRNCGKKSSEEIMICLFLYQYSKRQKDRRAAYLKRVMEMNV